MTHQANRSKTPSGIDQPRDDLFQQRGGMTLHRQRRQSVGHHKHGVERLDAARATLEQRSRGWAQDAPLIRAPRESLAIGRRAGQLQDLEPALSQALFLGTYVQIALDGVTRARVAQLKLEQGRGGEASARAPEADAGGGETVERVPGIGRS